MTAIEEPCMTLPEVELKVRATVAPNFADMDPGPLMVAVVELAEVEAKVTLRGELVDQPENA